MGDRDLFLGNSHATDHAAHDRSFETYSRSPPTGTCSRPTIGLVDGESNECSTFATAIAAEEGRRVSVTRSLVVRARPLAVVDSTLGELDVVHLAAGYDRDTRD